MIWYSSKLRVSGSYNQADQNPSYHPVTIVEELRTVETCSMATFQVHKMVLLNSLPSMVHIRSAEPCQLVKPEACVPFDQYRFFPPPQAPGNYHLFCFYEVDSFKFHI